MFQLLYNIINIDLVKFKCKYSNKQNINVKIFFYLYIKKRSIKGKTYGVFHMNKAVSSELYIFAKKEKKKILQKKKKKKKKKKNK